MRTEVNAADRMVVVGASLAGVRAAEELRRRGFRGDLSLVGREPHFPPYDRPPLSKQVLGHDWELEDARLRLFEDLDASMYLSREATDLDVTAATVSLDDGSKLEYDGLVIATGSRVRRINVEGADLPGVCYYRSAEDCARVREEVRTGLRVTVIGAGFIGSEVAAVLRRRGADVAVIDAAERPMAVQVGPELAGYLMRQHQDNGVRLHLGVGIAHIEGSDRARQVHLSDGTRIDTDLVIVGVGVAPETQWLEGSGLQVDNGVCCDEHCVAVGTSNIVAAGDVARWTNPLYGLPMRVEHWTNAIEQAEYAARVLLEGAAGPGYASVPYFWTDQYDMHLQMAGIAGEHYRLLEGSIEERKFVMATSAAGRDVGVLGVNCPSWFQTHRRELAVRLTPLAG